jgi:hypothetical protein
MFFRGLPLAALLISGGLASSGYHKPAVCPPPRNVTATVTIGKDSYKYIEMVGFG